MDLSHDNMLLFILPWEVSHGLGGMGLAPEKGENAPLSAERGANKAIWSQGQMFSELK